MALQAGARRLVSIPLLLLALTIDTSALAQAQNAEFMDLGSAKPVLDALAADLPPDLKSGGSVDVKAWNRWVKGQDAEIRKRLERGEEDTLTNLLRLGVTYTKEHRIGRELLPYYGHSNLVDASADTRADDLIRALSAPAPSPGIIEMRAFLERKGYSFESPEERARLKKYLLSNLARMCDEFAVLREKLRSGGQSALSDLFSDRGISLDTNLWPDYDLDQELQSLLRSGVLEPGSVRRVAVVGPGLDFANKDDGNEYYPPQTTQPFSLVDSLLRLRLAAPDSLELFTLDISPLVNIHVSRIQKRARAGQSYTVQLPWNSTIPRAPKYLEGFIEYWNAWGAQIGADVPPIPAPAAIAKELRVRAVKIRPEIAARVTPVDMNIVFQRMPLALEQRFDLIIGTNIFVYYGPFEQSLARANLAAMLKPGGVVLTNDPLSEAVPGMLPKLSRVDFTVSAQPLMIQTIFCYQRSQSPE